MQGNCLRSTMRNTKFIRVLIIRLFFSIFLATISLFSAISISAAPEGYPKAPASAVNLSSSALGLNGPL